MRSARSARRRVGTTPEGEADAVWATLRAAPGAMVAAGATGGIPHVEVATVDRTMDSLTHAVRGRLDM